MKTLITAIMLVAITLTSGCDNYVKSYVDAVKCTDRYGELAPKYYQQGLQFWEPIGMFYDGSTNDEWFRIQDYRTNPNSRYECEITLSRNVYPSAMINALKERDSK